MLCIDAPVPNLGTTASWHKTDFQLQFGNSGDGHDKVEPMALAQVAQAVEADPEPLVNGLQLVMGKVRMIRGLSEYHRPSSF